MMARQPEDLQQCKHEPQGNPADATRSRKEGGQPAPPRPCRLSREQAEKNIPADPDPDDPVSP